MTIPRKLSGALLGPIHDHRLRDGDAGSQRARSRRVVGHVLRRLFMRSVGGCMHHHLHIASRTIGKGSGPDLENAAAWADCAYACWGAFDARHSSVRGLIAREGARSPLQHPAQGQSRRQRLLAAAGGFPNSPSPLRRVRTDEEWPRSRSRTSSNRPHSTGRIPSRSAQDAQASPGTACSSRGRYPCRASELSNCGNSTVFSS